MLSYQLGIASLGVNLKEAAARGFLLLQLTASSLLEIWGCTSMAVTGPALLAGHLT